MKLKVKCPAKINLTLKVFKKNEITGFHPIESVMQTINLYDSLTVETTNSNKIELSGNSKETAYDGSNLVFKAANAFFNYAKIKNTGLKIYIEKNIPVAAGLAGGSTDAAGTIFALNKIYENTLNEKDIFEICAALGSDINFCYTGGRAVCRGKGDEIEKLPFEEFNLTLIKPKALKISTKDAYEAFDGLNNKSNLPNDLEFAMRLKYPELLKLSELGFKMSGSGPSFFIINPKNKINFDPDKYEIFENLKSIPTGVHFV